MSVTNTLLGHITRSKLEVCIGWSPFRSVVHFVLDEHPINVLALFLSSAITHLQHWDI